MTRALEEHSSTQVGVAQSFLFYSFSSSEIKIAFLDKCLLSSHVAYLWNENFISGRGEICLRFIHHSQ